LLAVHVASHARVHPKVPKVIEALANMRAFVSAWYTNVQGEKPRMADAFVEETKRHLHFVNILMEVKTILEEGT